MQIQIDYETETTVAAFRTSSMAEQAAAQLRAAHIGVSLISLPRGRYQLADASLGAEVTGVLRGACIGAPIGALAGVVLAISRVGWAPAVVVGLAVAVALAGALVGGLIGSAAGARFDDDMAESLVVQGRGAAVGVVAHTNLLDGSTARAYTILRQAGAIVFLDATTVAVEEAEPLEAAGALIR